MDRQDRHKCMAEARIHQESLIHPSKLCEKRQSQAWAMCRKVMIESIVLKEAGFKKRVAFVNSAIRLPVAFIGFR